VRRTALRSSQPKRDWTEARAKVDRSACRVAVYKNIKAGCEGEMEAAHIIGRECDQFIPAEEWHEDDGPLEARLKFADGYLRQEWNGELRVFPVRIVPLCRKHHRAYDAHELDLLPYLTVEEQAQAVLDAGGLELARNRICGGRDV
jgi:hypothetical protein